MASSLRRLAQSVPRLSRGFQTSPGAQSGAKKSGDITHFEIAHGDGHHGLRPGYTYDYEHGTHYLEPHKIPNFHAKWDWAMKGLFALGIGIPCFAVWFQQNKAKGG